MIDFLIILAVAGYGIAAIACDMALQMVAETALHECNGLPKLVHCFIVPMSLLWPLTLIVAMYVKALRWQAEQGKDGDS